MSSIFLILYYESTKMWKITRTGDSPEIVFVEVNVLNPGIRGPEARPPRSRRILDPLSAVLGR